MIQNNRENYPDQIEWKMVGDVFGIAGIALYCIFFLLYVYKILCYFDTFWEEWESVDRANLFSTISISLLLIADFATSNSMTDVALVLWIIGTVAQVFMSVVLVAKWISARIKIQEISPVFFIPVVGLAISPICGAKLGYIAVGNLLFGVGAFYFIVTFIIFWYRILFKGMMVEKAVPRLFITISPPSILSIAYSLLTGNFSTVPQMFFGVALFTAFLMFAIRLTQEKIPFSLGWWAYLFPLTALGSASWAFHAFVRDSSDASMTVSLVIAILCTAIVFLTWIYIMTFSVWTIVRQRLMFPCCHSDKIKM